MRKRNRTSLDIFNYMPYSKRVYLKNYGYHFNKASYEFACSFMWKETNGKEEGIKPVDKEILKTILNPNTLPSAGKGKFPTMRYMMHVMCIQRQWLTIWVGRSPMNNIWRCT